MVACCSVTWKASTSPMVMTPARSRPATTGRWRMRLAGIMAAHSSTGVSGAQAVTVAVRGADIADGRHGAPSGGGPNRYYGAAARCATRREPTLSPGLQAVSLGRLWHFTRGVLYDGARHYQRRRARRPRAPRGRHARAPRRIGGARWLFSGPRVSRRDRWAAVDGCGNPPGAGRGILRGWPI